MALPPLPPAQLPSPLQAVSHPLLSAYGVQLWCKRDDLIHPAISGNKWRKLKYHLLYAREQGKRHLLSFGGAYSITSMPWRRRGANLACALPASYAGAGSRQQLHSERCKGWGMDLVLSTAKATGGGRIPPGWPNSRMKRP